MTKKKNKESPTGTIEAYKGFDSKWKCRDFQYEVGKTYKHKGAVVRCASGGFHSCEYPLDVFSYYPPGEGGKYAVVNAGGSVDKDEGRDTKIASGEITIKFELSLPKFIATAVEWINARIDRTIEQTIVKVTATNTGNRSAATNTGNRSAATNTGDRSAATNTGDQSAATNTGNRSAATNTGYQSAATNTGDRSAATVEGPRSVAIATGFYGKAMACEGSAVVLVNRDDDGEIRHIRAAKVGHDGIKPGVFYSLGDDGEFVEA